MTHATAMSDQDFHETRELFLRQADAETAHDIDALDNVLIRPEPGQSIPLHSLPGIQILGGVTQ